MPPYRPPFQHVPKSASAKNAASSHATETDDGHYQPCKVVVMGLPVDIDEFGLVCYFNNFGTVKSWVIKSKSTEVFAFVEFDTPNSLERALMMAPHMIQGTLVSLVRVQRAYKFCLPSRPFPGMDPLTSPLRQAKLQEHMFGPAAVGASQLNHETSTRSIWDSTDFEQIVGLWA